MDGIGLESNSTMKSYSDIFPGILTFMCFLRNWKVMLTKLSSDYSLSCLTAGFRVSHICVFGFDYILEYVVIPNTSGYGSYEHSKSGLYLLSSLLSWVFHISGKPIPGYYQHVSGRDQGSRTYISDWITYHKIAKEFPGVNVENAEKGLHKLH